jgi:hypothetical protein
VVEVAAGTYPSQTISADTSKTSWTDVTFVPAPGATVVIGCRTITGENGRVVGGQSCIDVYASHIAFEGGVTKGFQTQSYTVDNFTYQGRIDTERGAEDITFRNMDIGAVAVGSSHTLVSHNDLGPSIDPLNMRQADGDSDVWQDNLVHDFVVVNAGHFECMTWDGGTNVTFEYNEWRSCAIFSIFAKPVENISGTIDHNAFWNPRGLTNNDDVKISTGSGATRCDVATTNNWISEGYLDACPGTTDSGNTFHSPSAQPPSPIRP